MPVRRQSKCKELSNGLIIRKDTASSGAMMAQTFSFTIPQSPGMDTAHCKRETRSNLKLSRGQRVPRRPMFQNPGVERPRNHSAGRERPSAGHFFGKYWSLRKLRRLRTRKYSRAPCNIPLVEKSLSRSAVPVLPRPPIPHLPPAAGPIISFIMDNKQIARILRETAQLLEIDGAIIGRYRSYEKAAELIDGLPESIEQ